MHQPRRVGSHLLVLAMIPAALFLTGCATPSRVNSVTPAGVPGDPLEAAYRAALDDAAYPTRAETAPLLALVPDTPGVSWKDGKVLVTTWTRSGFFSDSVYQPGYVFPLYGDTWVTAGSEVADACSEAARTGPPADVQLRIEQLLGLPPGGKYDAFLRVWIDPAIVFRPCAVPDPTASTCPVAAPLTSAGPDKVGWACSSVQDAHGQWLCNTWVDRYGNRDLLSRYPWTALGYTYDWSPGAPDRVGATEFVALAKTEVTFEALVPTADFCASSR